MTFFGTTKAVLPRRLDSRTPGSMMSVPFPRRSAQNAVASQQFETIDVSLDSETNAYWCHRRPEGRPVVTHALLADLHEMQASLVNLFQDNGAQQPPFSYVVFASRAPGIYLLGGDLEFFADRMRAGDRAAIQRYAQGCIEVVYNNSIAFSLPVVTIALVQGDALGGGFECALSCDLIVAERSAKMGLPETLFNLFPGMGAYSFLSRRLDPARAQKMILSGKIYTAEELHEMGLIDVLAEDGQGEQAVRDYIKRNAHKHSSHFGFYQARRRCNPVTWDELSDVVDAWVDTVFRLSDADLRKMARLTAAQNRRLQRLDAPVACAAE